MIKAFILLVKRPDLDAAAFGEHWLHVHGPLALRMRTLHGYVQNHCLPGGMAEFPVDNPWSGIAEVSMDTLADAEAIPTDPDYLSGLYPDEPNFLVRERTHYLFTTEHRVIPPPELPVGATDGPVKSLFLTRRRPGMDVAAFRRHWLERHAPLVLDTPGLLGYTQAHVLDECYGQGDPDFDGVAELWWADRGAFETAWHSRAHMDVQLEDLRRFVDLGTTVGMLVQPYRLL